MVRTVLSIFLALCVLPLVAAAQGTVDLYIFAGQSNADGRGEVSDLSAAQLESLQSDAIINYLNPGSERDRANTESNPPDLDVGTNGFVDLVPDGGFSGGFSVNRTSTRELSPTFGAELSFAASISEATGSDNQIAIVKVTRGGASLRNDFLPTFDINTEDDAPQGFAYRALIEQVTTSIAALEAQGNTVNVEGFFWHQGESDSQDNDDQVGSYTENFAALVDGVRGEFGADIPFVLSELAQNRTSTDGSAPFNDNLNNVVAAREGLSFVSSVGLTTPGDTNTDPDLDEEDLDFTHFDAESQVELGRRFAAAFATTSVPEPSSGMIVFALGLGLAARRNR